MRVCQKRAGKFCCHCPEFPCERLRHLDRRYQKKYRMSEIANLEFIREKGIRKFVESERDKWTSPYGVRCVHDGKSYK